MSLKFMAWFPAGTRDLSREVGRPRKRQQFHAGQ
jgi:hypothetical protein